MNPPGKSAVERFALPILIAGVVAIGLSPILVRLSEVGPVATAVSRMALPLPLFALVLWLRPQERLPLATPKDRRDFWIIALSGVFFAGDLGLWHWSIKLTSVANATVLSNLAPIFVVLGAWLIFKERIRTLFVIGLVLAVAGIGVLMSESVRLSADTFNGDLFGIACSTFYGAYLLAISHARRRASTLAIMTVSGITATITLWIFAAALEDQIWPHTLHGWGVAIALALIVQVGGQTLITTALAHIPASFGSTVLLLQPVVAALLAWIIFGEPLSAAQAIGGIAILGGIELARRASQQTTESAPPS
jgi:drug/metabolite transporter (DMT)-like permease